MPGSSQTPFSQGRTVQRFCLLLAISGGLAGCHLLLKDAFLFSYYREYQDILYFTSALPLACAASLLMSRLAGARGALLLWLALPVAFAPAPVWGAALVAGAALLYWLERASRKMPGSTAALVLLALFLFFLPSFWNRLEPGAWFWIIQILRVAWPSKFLAWVVEKRIYGRNQDLALPHFLEYFFCPVYFLFPSALNYISAAHHFGRKREPSRRECWNAFGLAAWGIFWTAVFSWVFRHFWAVDFWNYLRSQGDGAVLPIFLGGVGSLLLFTIHHMAFMSLQVACARLLGIQFRYDMVHPLLSRNPLEYFMRHHNFVREFLVEIGVRPLSLFMLRLRLPVSLTYFLSIVGVYSILMLGTSHYRPFMLGRPYPVTFAYIAFVAVGIGIPVALAYAYRRMGWVNGLLQRFLAGELKPLRRWNWIDWVGSLLTFLLVSASRASHSFFRVLLGY